MRLIGYIKELMINSFTIPVYCEGNDYYYHNLDENYIITAFIKSTRREDDIIICDTYLDFKIGEYGSLVFVGENKVFIDSANLVIDKISSYLNETISSEKYLHTKKEVQDIKETITANNMSIICNGLIDVGDLPINRLSLLKLIGRKPIKKIIADLPPSRKRLLQIDSQSRKIGAINDGVVVKIGGFNYSIKPMPAVVKHIAPKVGGKFEGGILKFQKFCIEDDIKNITTKKLLDFISLKKNNNDFLINGNSDYVLLNSIFNKFLLHNHSFYQTSKLRYDFILCVIDKLNEINKKYYSTKKSSIETRKTNQTAYFKIATPNIKE